MVLGNALSLVRFPLMTKEEFTSGPAQSGLLNYEEANIIIVFIYISHVYCNNSDICNIELFL